MFHGIPHIREPRPWRRQWPQITTSPVQSAQRNGAWSTGSAGGPAARDGLSPPPSLSVQKKLCVGCRSAGGRRAAVTLGRVLAERGGRPSASSVQLPLTVVPPRRKVLSSPSRLGQGDLGQLRHSPSRPT